MKRRNFFMTFVALFMTTMLSLGLYSCENDDVVEVAPPAVVNGAYTVSGVLADNLGMAIAGADVTINGITVKTAADGSYSIPLTQSGRYVVTYKVGSTTITRSVDVQPTSDGKITIKNDVINLGSHQGGSGE